MDTLYKQPSESRRYFVRFHKFPEIEEGAVISAISEVDYTVEEGTETTALSLSDESPGENGQSAVFRIAGGTHDVLYKVTAKVTTDQGDTLEGGGYLWVYDF